MSTMTKTCKIENCNGDGKRRGMCPKHYRRVMKYGNPNTYRPDATRHCAVNECDRDHYAKGHCKLHYDRVRKTGDPNKNLPHFSPLAGKHGEKNPQWVGDDAGYEAVHRRLTKTRGNASSQTCKLCGGKAHHWAYDNMAKNEKVTKNGLRYSVSIKEHYIPLCRSCHRRFDARWRALRENGAEAIHPTIT